MWPLNSGIWSGSFPFSLSGMTAKEPPPPASQLTERYFGLTYIAQSHVSSQLLSHCPPGLSGLLRGEGWVARDGREGSYRGGGRGLVTGRGGSYLYEVGVPRILADVEVIVAVLLPRRLAIDVS